MKMISRRDFLKASAVVGATGVLTACGGSSASTAASSTAASTAASSTAAAASGSANVGVCIYQFADNFMTLYRTDLEEYLKDMGYAVTIVDGKNDQNTQTEQINTFLQQGVDVLIINPVQTTSAQTIVDTIKPSETPIVFINREPDKSVLDSYADKCCYVGADARQSGTYQGELILETETQGDINGDGKITYIMCKGDPENIDAQYRTEYSIKALTDAGKGSRVPVRVPGQLGSDHRTAGRRKRSGTVRREDRSRLLQQRRNGTGRSAVPAAGWPYRRQGRLSGRC